MSSTSAAMSLTAESSPRKKCGMKRLRFEEEWKRTQKKLKKDSVKAYTMVNSVLKKQLLAIRCKCAYNCHSIDDMERERIFREFYKPKSHDVKYLFGPICKQPVKVRLRTCKNGSLSPC